MPLVTRVDVVDDARSEQTIALAWAGYLARGGDHLIVSNSREAVGEVKRNGGQGCYGATQADQAAWDRANPSRARIRRRW